MSDFKAIRAEVEQSQDATREKRINYMIRQFHGLYMPEEAHAAREFATDLAMLIREAYVDAGRPYHKEMIAILEKALPLFTYRPEGIKEGKR